MIQHSIDTKDAHPVKQRLRRVPLHLKGVVKNEVKKLLQKNLIEPSISPWASSLVLVKKKLPDQSGAVQYRVCIDYRPLNSSRPRSGVWRRNYSVLQVERRDIAQVNDVSCLTRSGIQRTFEAYIAF